MNIAGKRFPIWLVLVYILSLLIIVAWPLTAFSSLFMFDAPGSANSATSWSMAGFLTCYPLLTLGGVLSSYLLYRRDKRVPSLVLAAIGAIPAVVFGLVFTIMPIVVALGSRARNF